MPTIALVDDERNILTSVAHCLWRPKATRSDLHRWRRGARGLNDDPADLAILDIKMPRMDGMELLRRLRQRTDMPVIFLTSKDEEIDELFGLKMGADDYIPSRSRSAWWSSASRRCCAASSRKEPAAPPPTSRRACSSAASCSSIPSATPAPGTASR